MLPGMLVLDPIAEILKEYPSPVKSSYHHDGNSDFLMGVIDPRGQHTKLIAAISSPPPGGAPPRAATLCPDLEAMVRALRDSELLAVSAIPRSCIINRYEIYE